MSRCALVLAAAVSLAAARALADPLPAGVRAHAARRTTPITIDGRLDEPAWQTAPRQHGFTQRFPTDGIPATQDTSFAILYDDEAVYVGVWAADSEPSKIKALLTRRDVDSPGDEVIVGFDSYHDRRTSYAFQLNAAGVQRDMIVFDDSNQDDTWDAVWTGNSARTADGWTAEYRIPLSQLRYETGESKVWGFQIVRYVGRTQEQSSWSPWPRSSPGIVSRFGLLDGIDHLVPARRLELLPYVTGGLERQPVDVGDPLNKQYAPRGGVGLDLKYGLGPAFTLSATINPDFGQVEADPSQITLGPFELFYPEKRPFFLEGTDLFRLPFGHNDNSIETAFYSRRIGGAPELTNLDYAYADAPKSTTIYSAAKLTGKTSGGWSVGLLDAVTGKEDVPLIDEGGVQHDPLAAPLTNYAVARVKRDLRDGATQIGGSFTAVDRDLADPHLVGTLHDQAYTGGVQVLDRWDHDAWQLRFNAIESYIHGSPNAIALTQQDANHYFQRPDASDETFDPTRTSMMGTGFDWRLGRDGDVKHWRFGMGGEMRSPGLEINDLGFQQGSDRLLTYYYINYRQDTPSPHLLNWNAAFDVYELNTLEPRLTDAGFDYSVNAMAENYWNMGFGGSYDDGRWDVISMRGGPALHSDPSTNVYAYLNTDNRKWIWFSIGANFNITPAQDQLNGGLNVGATIQARPNVDLFIGPGWSVQDNPLQYVAQAIDPADQTHYVFAHISQTTANMTMRLNWTFSTHLSLQAYAQPFVATGRYDAFKDVNHAGAAKFQDRFTPINGNSYAEDDSYLYIHDGNQQYTIARPDFDIRQLRSTIVLRWEYRPGSSLFAIWSHGQTNTLIDGRFDLSRDLSGLASDPSDDVVMVKLNYWLGL
jgi:hypothetical protein